MNDKPLNLKGFNGFLFFRLTQRLSMRFVRAEGRDGG
jgi:hypothetical protein